MQKNNHVTIDTLRLMLPSLSETRLAEQDYPVEVDEFVKILKLDKIFDHREEVSQGLNGYTRSFIYGGEEIGPNISIMFNPKHLDTMGVLCEISSTAKSTYEGLARIKSIEVDWQKIIMWVYRRTFSQSKYEHRISSGHVSRIDIATDFINYGFSIDQINQKLMKDEYQFLNSRHQLIQKRRIKTINYDNKTLTIYVGSREADAYLRLYDKKRQEIDTNGRYKGLAKSVNDWVRFEGEFKKRKAHAIGKMISELPLSVDMYSYLVDVLLQHWSLIDNEIEDYNDRKN